MNIQEIREIIPHRYPMLLTGRAGEVVEGGRIIAKKNVTINESFFRGHFPEEPVTPGALIVEIMAQVRAVVLLSFEQFKGETVYLGGLDRVKFRKKVIPGDTLHLEVGVLKVKTSAGISEGIAKVDGKKVAEAESTLMVEQVRYAF